VRRLQRIARLKVPKEISATPPESLNSAAAVAKPTVLAFGRRLEFDHPNH
jgi:hypothetical protein